MRRGHRAHQFCVILPQLENDSSAKLLFSHAGLMLCVLPRSSFITNHPMSKYKSSYIEEFEAQGFCYCSGSPVPDFLSSQGLLNPSTPALVSRNFNILCICENQKMKFSRRWSPWKRTKWLPKPHRGGRGLWPSKNTSKILEQADHEP